MGNVSSLIPVNPLASRHHLLTEVSFSFPAHCPVSLHCRLLLVSVSSFTLLLLVFRQQPALVRQQRRNHGAQWHPARKQVRLLFLWQPRVLKSKLTNDLKCRTLH